MDTIWRVPKHRFIAICEHVAKYKALTQLIDESIKSGELKHKQKLPAQRWLADELSVTHGTVTRAYELAEKRGLVKAKRGAGTFVTCEVIHEQNIQEIDFASSMQPMLGQQNILSQALNELAQDTNAVVQIMTYSINGINKHRHIFTDWLNTKGIMCGQEELIFTQGAQQGIYTCLQILTQPGDVILHEELTYPGFFKAAETTKLKTLGVPLVSDGIDLVELEKICQNHQPKVLYITPNSQNPTNIRYSQEQKNKILALSRQYQFFIIEDDVNYCFDTNWCSPMQQQMPDRVFYISSISKYFAGGLRVGYVLAPVLFRQMLKDHVHSQCWMVSTMNFELLSRFIGSDNYQLNQTYLAQELHYRQAEFKKLFERYQLTARFGGLNIWLMLPDSLNMHHINGLLIAHKVKVRTANSFINPAELLTHNAIRISLGGPATRVLFDKGIETLDVIFSLLDQSNDVVI